MRTGKVVRGGLGMAMVALLCGAAVAADTAPASAPEIVDRGAATPKAALETLAELFVQSRELSQATEALTTTPAVPQDLWQEMRRTEAAARGQ